MQTNYMLGEMKFVQEDLMVVSAVSQLGGVVAAAVAAALLPKLGPWKGYALGVLIFAAQPAMFILSPGQSGAYIGGNLGLIAALGNAFLKPAQFMFLSGTLRLSDVTRAQSSLFVFSALPKAIATAAFTALFYGSRERIQLGFYVSSAVLLTMLVPVLAILPREVPEQAPQRQPGEQVQLPCGACRRGGAPPTQATEAQGLGAATGTRSV